ncbi:MAG: site-specific DNA-methyltransferase, partial [Thermoleophilia bacterium]|nr:site-specific DNA-methyltransferase [Thermoleophilia bacterium]
MAHLDNLIDSVQDPDLRNALQNEVRKVLSNRQFGLVFNPHKPESILLPGFKVRRGDKVRVLSEGSSDRSETDDSGVWIVLNIKDGAATLRSKTDVEITRDVPHDRLVVVREFGDPIFPGLKSTDRIERASDKPWHALINGENFHALQALLYPYEGKVDAIYIDPPYNTRDKDWKYNNDYVDTTDPYKHSKWLSMMERRLRLAKRLLDPTRSALVITIDEKEIHRLALLTGQIFGDSEIQMVTSVINPMGSRRGAQFSRVEEYLLVIFIGDQSASDTTIDMLGRERRANSSEGTAVRWTPLNRDGNGWQRAARPNMFYPLFVDPDTKIVREVGESIPLNVDRSTIQPPEGTIAVWPFKGDEEARWQVGRDTCIDLLARGLITVGRVQPERNSATVKYLTSGAQERITNGQYRVDGKRPDGSLIVVTSSEIAMRPASVWNLSSHSARDHGSALLSKLLPGRDFPFPKSLYAVEDTLRFFVGDNPNALVLDFFAGSGTTAHAVARLNRQDAGRRRCILVTNNEVSPDESKQLRSDGHYPGDPSWEALGICEYITKPRVRAAFTGETPDGKPIEGEYKFVDEFPMSEG